MTDTVGTRQRGAGRGKVAVRYLVKAVSAGHAAQTGTLSDVDNWGAFRTMLHGRIALVHALDEGDPNGRAEIILDALMEETGGIEGVCIGKLSVPKSALLLVRNKVQ